jgi:hypothetical protein
MIVRDSRDRRSLFTNFSGFINFRARSRAEASMLSKGFQLHDKDCTGLHHARKQRKLSGSSESTRINMLVEYTMALNPAQLDTR